MNQLTNTHFFLLLKKNGNDTSELEQEYDKFIALLFAEGNTFKDRIAYLNTLVYTRVELSELTKVSKKNTTTYLRKAIEIVDRRVEWVEQLILAEQNASTCPICRQPQSQILEWTGSQMELVELIYALHEAGCFGDISLKKLFCIMEQVVGCEVKNHYRLFWDIRNRTGEERTYFLNKLIKKLSEKLILMDSEGWR